ncbi:large-conductance mechanosensitive channel [Nocardioides psychrotolerans]|uniref:Large conductance mechanosensitive channel n=1 Tax=Nocardioides psychrotolerans TaxID=1005945 RepID=A0A1I3RQA7_9ACTN|nr:MscL family protein [Nocardioides psychrotolerans]GEP40634.1 large-conductance mechanosensitive channel [Nocardioides psychrotolerans]SFJ48062.1 large conductance mechanosensitive channel [Nocardioides psychrotolerans]
MTGFKNFILRGNLIDLAVAVILGTAFTAVVTAFTGMLMSAIARITGGKEPNFDTFAPGDVLVGPFITALVAFLILAAVVYFFVVTPYVRAKEKFFPSPEPGTPEDVRLLQEIRDLLANRPQV